MYLQGSVLASTRRKWLVMALHLPFAKISISCADVLLDS